MQKLTNCLHILVILFFCSQQTFAQNPDDTEFRKGWVTYLKLDNGLTTDFHAAPDLYIGGMQLNPQVTVIVNRLRLGINAGFAYNDKKLSGLAGPSLAYKIKSFDLGEMGGLANLQLVAEHTWGTNSQQLLGGGIGLEALQKILLLFTVHRDYDNNRWWLQSHIGIRLNKTKRTTPDFNE
jgi:hypothetical protein